MSFSRLHPSGTTHRDHAPPPAVPAAAFLLIALCCHACGGPSSGGDGWGDGEVLEIDESTAITGRQRFPPQPLDDCGPAPLAAGESRRWLLRAEPELRNMSLCVEIDLRAETDASLRIEAGCIALARELSIAAWSGDGGFRLLLPVEKALSRGRRGGIRSATMHMEVLSGGPVHVASVALVDERTSPVRGEFVAGADFSKGFPSGGEVIDGYGKPVVSWGHSRVELSEGDRVRMPVGVSSLAGRRLEMALDCTVPARGDLHWTTLAPVDVLWNGRCVARGVDLGSGGYQSALIPLGVAEPPGPDGPPVLELHLRGGPRRVWLYRLQVRTPDSLD